MNIEDKIGINRGQRLSIAPVVGCVDPPLFLCFLMAGTEEMRPLEQKFLINYTFVSTEIHSRCV